MTKQSPSDIEQQSDDIQPPVETKDETKDFDTLQEQHLTLKQEVERLYENINQIRGLLQTVGSGLIIAILIAIGISGWYAYRLLMQEKLAQQNAADAAAIEAELRQILEDIETKVQQQERQLEQLGQDVPDTLTSVTELSEQIEDNQRNLDQLRDRLEQWEDDQSDSTSDN